MKKLKPIGSSFSLIQEIKTTPDGGAIVRLAFGKEDIKLIQDLMARSMNGITSVFVAFVEPSKKDDFDLSLDD